MRYSASSVASPDVLGVLVEVLVEVLVWVLVGVLGVLKLRAWPSTQESSRRATILGSNSSFLLFFLMVEVNLFR